jgi:tRNA threonylcarbamoyl adenosine modification protein YeaZ
MATGRGVRRVKKLLLALDTSTEVTAVGLAWDRGATAECFACAQVDAPRAAMSQVLPTAVSLLADAGLAPADIDAVVVGRGPGSFTGVRIGVASAKGLAHGLGRPLYGVGTLDAIAWNVARERPEPMLLGVVGDAMRGEVYPALFRLESGRASRLAEDYVSLPIDAAREWAALGEKVVLVGNGLRKHGDAFADALDTSADVLPEALWAPTADGLFLAFDHARSTGAAGNGAPGELLPIYTRLSDAEENENVRLGRPRGALPGNGVAGDRS